VEQLIKEGHIREKMAALKSNIKDAVADEFGDIVNEVISKFSHLSNLLYFLK
jgi:hypothetical protein